MTIIPYIKIEFQVHEYIQRGGADYSELRATVHTAAGEQAGFTQVIPNDDLLSRFDWLWARAGEELKSKLKEGP